MSKHIQNMLTLSLKPLNWTLSSSFTIAGGAISCKLEAFITGAHEWAVRVQAAVRAWVCHTLVHIWPERKRKTKKTKDRKKVTRHFGELSLNIAIKADCVSTLACPGIRIKKKSRATGTGIWARDVSAQLLAVTISTLINI